eukprot:NODE_1428_length_863_cov_75.415761_g1382_i0.p1 GENE.NODE_1428_length_863_cov_75.415761_g1382_i0~~NODE_1428_length_863_cov_75.415761_g1382_i0.p1  ORF type:complete len:251 (+),score=50.94 NODE_1428_length_863_cov_75.415761_g1382_i0:64-816(+)
MRWILLFAFVSAALGSVLLEVEFDIAPVEQQEQGQSVSSILTAYLQDPNLQWMRYLNTLVDGTPEKTPSRIAFIEFAGVKEWGEFEKAQKGPTHVLLDIYWLPWRRLPWMSSDNEPEVKPVAKRVEQQEGYVYIFKYSVSADKAGKFAELSKSSLPRKVAALNSNAGFLDRKVYTEGAFQSQFSHMALYEFTSLESMLEIVYKPGALFELEAAVKDCFSSFAATAFQPPYERGGNILQGKEFRGNAEEGK